MNSYALAFGILGGGVALAVFLWLLPRFRQGLTVRRFRKALHNVDLVAMSWSQVDQRHSDDLRTTPPGERRPWRRRNPQSDDPGASLV